ncbi:MAG: hypothetical protein K2H84_02445, partial [Paramuribaculum sp.]|nr:hypothetical protein [Paramuribaculum sp.]
VLTDINYIGYVSLEWVKRWTHRLFDGGIVVPHFAEFMKPYQTKHKHTLQDNMRNIDTAPLRAVGQTVLNVILSEKGYK